MKYLNSGNPSKDANAGKRDALWRFVHAIGGLTSPPYPTLDLPPPPKFDLPTLQPTSLVAGIPRYDLVYNDLEVEARKRIISQLYYELWADVLEAGLYGPPKDKTP